MKYCENNLKLKLKSALYKVCQEVLCSYEQPEEVPDELQGPGDQREAEHGETEAAVQQPRDQARGGGGRGRAVAAAGAGVGVASVSLDSRRDYNQCHTCIVHRTFTVLLPPAKKCAIVQEMSEEADLKKRS